MCTQRTNVHKLHGLSETKKAPSNEIAQQVYQGTIEFIRRPALCVHNDTNGGDGHFTGVECSPVAVEGVER